MQINVLASLQIVSLLVIYSTLSEAAFGNAFFKISVIMTYDRDKNLYAPIDQNTIAEYSLNSSEVLCACPIQDQNTGETFYDKLNVKVVYKNFVASTEDMRACGHHYKLSMVENVPRIRYNYNVGYYLLDTEEILSWPQHDIPTLSTTLNISQGSNRQKVYELEICMATVSTTSTRHRINSYKRFIYTAPKPCPSFHNNITAEYVDDIKRFYKSKNIAKLLANYDTKITDFVPTQLTPVDDFTDDLSRDATCTYRNTVPITSPVAKGPIRKLETVIRYVADILKGNTLEVTTKTYGTLELCLKKGSEISNRKVYLDFKSKNIPVPKIFMKILHYKVPYSVAPNDGQDHSADSPRYKSYYMVFGIYHTLADASQTYDIDYVKGSKCDYKTCEQYGWKIITNRYVDEARFFCCSVQDSESMKALELDLDEYRGEIFDLNMIPTEIAENGDV